MWRLRTVSSTESRLTVTVIGVLFIFRNTERTFLVRSTFTWRLKVKEISLDNSILFWSLSEKIETRKKKKKERKKKERNLAKDLWPADCNDETFSFLVLVSVLQITQILFFCSQDTRLCWTNNTLLHQHKGKRRPADLFHGGWQFFYPQVMEEFNEK